MDAAHLRAEHAGEVDGRAGAMKREPDAGGIAEIGGDGTELPDLRQRLDGIGLARVALGDADPDSALEQEFADVAADESAAAEDGYKLFRPVDHGVAR
jgi:hypothetical protein